MSWCSSRENVDWDAALRGALVPGLRFDKAHIMAFYGMIAVATTRGATLNFTGLDPIKALVWSAVVNGILAAPVMG